MMSTGTGDFGPKPRERSKDAFRREVERRMHLCMTWPRHQRVERYRSLKRALLIAVAFVEQAIRDADDGPEDAA